MIDRAARADRFIASVGWTDATRVLVAGDASNRRYDRLRKTNGTTAILMDAPAEKGEDVRPFVKIAQYLTGIHLSAPHILNVDEENGFLLLEDLGDDLFARVLDKNASLETQLYTAATDVLVNLHTAPVPQLEPYNAHVMTELAALSYDWYLLGANDTVDTTKRHAFTDAFHALVLPLDAEKRVVIQRDYHAENLIWLPERTGVSRVGLLDFQSAMIGHPAYDLMSVLQDARRDVSRATERSMIEHYITTTGIDHDRFTTAYAVLGVQRNLRILGVFTRLCMAHGKASYIDLIPRVWEHILTNLRHPAMISIRQQLLDDLPAPTPRILEKLKTKCATIQLP